MTFYKLTLKPTQEMFLGTGGGSGYSRTSRSFIPGSTLLGAIVARKRLLDPNIEDSDLETHLRGFSVSDAVLKGSEPVPLDRLLCKYPVETCPKNGYGWWAITNGTCKKCEGNLVPSKGERRAPKNTVKRVALSPSEQAKDDRLYEREALDVRGETLCAFVESDASDVESKPATYFALDDNAEQAAPLRVGGARSVAGRVEQAAFEKMQHIGFPTAKWLRLELLTPGVFIDDFGFPTDRPTSECLQRAFGVSGLRVEKAWTRWTTVGGWGTRSGVKPEDAAVIAHSVYLVHHQPEEGAAGPPGDDGPFGVDGVPARMGPVGRHDHAADQTVGVPGQQDVDLPGGQCRGVLVDDGAAERVGDGAGVPVGALVAGDLVVEREQLPALLAGKLCGPIQLDVGGGVVLGVHGHGVLLFGWRRRSDVSPVSAAPVSLR